MFDVEDGALEDRFHTDCQVMALAYMSCRYMEEIGAGEKNVQALSWVLGTLQTRLEERFAEVVGRPYDDTVPRPTPPARSN